MTTASQHNPSFDHSGGRRRAEREQDACRGFKSRGPGRVEAFRGVGGIKRVEAFRGWRHSEGGGIQRVEAFRGQNTSFNHRGRRPDRVEAFSGVGAFRGSKSETNTELCFLSTATQQHETYQTNRK
ncbi:unnamed protein product [Arctogadus glacialis]